MGVQRFNFCAVIVNTVPLCEFVLRIEQWRMSSDTVWILALKGRLPYGQLNPSGFCFFLNKATSVILGSGIDSFLKCLGFFFVGKPTFLVKHAIF